MEKVNVPKGFCHCCAENQAAKGEPFRKLVALEEKTSKKNLDVLVCPHCDAGEPATK